MNDQPALAVAVVNDVAQRHGLPAASHAVQDVADGRVRVVGSLEATDDLNGRLPDHDGRLLEGTDLRE